MTIEILKVDMLEMPIPSRISHNYLVDKSPIIYPM